MATNINIDASSKQNYLGPDVNDAITNSDNPSAINPFLTASQIVGGLPTGAIPSNYVTRMSSLEISSPTFDDVPSLSTTVTVTAAVRAYCLFSFEASATGADAQIEFKVVVNGETSDIVMVDFAKASNSNGSINFRTTNNLSIGSHVVKVQARKVGGNKIASLDKGFLFTFALQAPKGETGAGVPIGGTTNQVLSKIDGSDYNTQWVTPASGGSSSPFVPMTMMAQGDNEFACFASIIVRPTGTVTNGAPITWEILNNSDGHGSSFIRSALGQGSQSLRFVFPSVKNVFSFVTAADESYSKNGVITGSTVGLTTADMFAYRTAPSGFLMTGNGSGWTLTSLPSNSNPLSVSSTAGGLTAFDIVASVNNFSSNSTSISYVGTNNYRIERAFSGLPGTAAFGFYLVDIATNTRVTTQPTSLDRVVISNPSILNIPLNLNTWGNPTSLSAQQMTNIFMSVVGFNFWCIALFELWMKVCAVSSTELLAKWQAKSGVTSYKLKRSTAFAVDGSGNYILTSPTTVYTGTALQFADTGLTPNTMYYYQLTDQADVEITQFNTKTKVS